MAKILVVILVEAKVGFSVSPLLPAGLNLLDVEVEYTLFKLSIFSFLVSETVAYKEKAYINVQT